MSPFWTTVQTVHRREWGSSLSTSGRYWHHFPDLLHLFFTCEKLGEINLLLTGLSEWILHCYTFLWHNQPLSMLLPISKLNIWSQPKSDDGDDKWRQVTTKKVQTLKCLPPVSCRGLGGCGWDHRSVWKRKRREVAGETRQTWSQPKSVDGDDKWRRWRQVTTVTTRGVLFIEEAGSLLSQPPQ